MCFVVKSVLTTRIDKPTCKQTFVNAINIVIVTKAK